jgi:formate dehydrogenase major subunit
LPQQKLVCVSSRRAAQGKARRDPQSRHAEVLALKWDYPIEGEHREPVAEEGLQEINGYKGADGELIPGFTALKADGSTACGCWIYSGVFPKKGEDRANQCAAKGFYGQGWDSRGRPTGEFSTIAPLPVPAANEKSWYGGMPKVRNGPVWTFPTSR